MIENAPSHPARNGDLRFEAIADSVTMRLAKNKRVRRNLPGGGRMRMDRQLPFLCVYRRPVDVDDLGTRELITTEAAYLFASGDSQYHDGLRHLVHQTVSTMEEHFGVFLLLEIWASDTSRSATAHSFDAARSSLDPSQSEQTPNEVKIDIFCPTADALPSVMETLQQSLQEIRLEHRKVVSQIHPGSDVLPPGLPPLVTDGDSEVASCCRIGLAIDPVYRSAASDEDATLYPVLLQSLRRQLAPAIRKTVAEFSGVQQSPSQKSRSQERPSRKGHAYHSLGPSSLVKAAKRIDRQLDNIAQSFDFLLQVTPTNSDEAWRSFKESGYRRLPPLIYRPLPYDPNVLKRQLFNIELERIEDPVLAHLFWEKRREIDRQLSALTDLDTENFLPSSLQIYGRPDQELIELASTILNSISGDAGGGPCVGTDVLLDRATKEIAWYQSKRSDFDASIEVTDGIAAGIMVSRNRLLIGRDLSLAESRVEALLQHEIGTHLLTHFNGRCQPFHQLRTGLAGYEELQEGIAVLSEFLVGGLTARRSRTLAGRVIAVDSVAAGASFAQTFESLRETWGFSPRSAFRITFRVHRGGGLTKDVIYLRGLRDLIGYLADGHDVEPLYVGKIGLQHVPYVQEMRRRGVIVPPRLLPRFWDDPESHRRLKACREISVLQLLETDL